MEGLQIFDSILPNNADWEEINNFFKSNAFRGEIISKDWKLSKAFQVFLLSEKSMKVMECLHNDLYKCYYNVFARQPNGTEDRAEEYRLLRKHLFSKYERISDIFLERIYSDYLISDR